MLHTAPQHVDTETEIETLPTHMSTTTRDLVLEAETVIKICAIAHPKNF